MNQLIDSEEQLAAEYHEPLVEELLEWQMHDAVNPMQMPWAVPSLYGFDAPALERWRGRTSRARGLQKQRFCATYPNVSRCRHGASCAFAHAREEVTAPLLTPEEEAALPESLTVDFFTQRFKTMWCPIGAQHDWQSCMYAHTYQDVRRPPTIGYGHQLCPYWNKKETNLPYAQRCPLGPRCPYAHGAKEQLYHPDYFRSLVCRDLQRRRCPRAHLCAFFHRQSDCRKIKHDPVDYARPLPEKAVPPEWLQHFLNPPKFQEAADGYVEPYLPESLMPAMMSLMGYGKEEWDSGTESTAEELHEDAETTSSQAATLAPPGLGFTEDAWAALLCKNEDMYWREVMPYFNPYSEVGFKDFEEGAYAASVQAAHGSSLRKPLKGSEAPASLLSHLGLGDAAM